MLISPTLNLDNIKNLPESSEIFTSAGCGEAKPKVIPFDVLVSPFLRIRVSFVIISFVTTIEIIGSPTGVFSIVSEAFGIIFASMSS